MTPAELREFLEYFSDDEKIAVNFVARELDASTGMIRNWLQDRAPVPGPAAVAIKLLCELHVCEPHGRLEPSMTREELFEAMDELYDDPLISQRQHRLAADLGVSPTTVLSWSGKRRPLRGPASAAIQMMLKKKRRQT